MTTNPYTLKALELIKHGYTPLPLHEKAPCVNDWQKLRHVTEDQIYDWERCGWFQNIGMSCGAASDNMVVLDFDGLPGFDLFAAKFPELLNTLTIATGSGQGKHLYYKVDLLPESKPVKNIPLPETGELVNIEIRADGLQVVIPPSIHPDTKKPYTIEKRVPIMHLFDFEAVKAWVIGLKPDTKQKWEPPAYHSQSDAPLNPKLLVAVEAYFMSQSHTLHRNWINCSCPNHTAHKNGDKDFSFGYSPEYGAGHCFVCEGMNLKQICGYIGIDPAAYGGIYEKQEPAAQQIRIAQAAPQIISQSQPALAGGIPVVTRSSRLSSYQTRLYDYETPRDNPPVPFPLQALHTLGGMARVIKPGKLVGIVGISGGGKTSLLESMVDSWLTLRVPALVWSPEWDGDEFIERAVQRYGGAKVDDLYLHEIFVWEKQQGVQNGAGKELPKTTIDQSDKAIRILRGWEDEVGYLDCPFLTIGYLQAQIETTLKNLSFKPRVLILDYVQLLLAMEQNADLTMYNLLMRIKAVCKAYNLVGVIATQVTKDSTKKQADGTILDGLAARYVNDDAFNLFITVNPERDEQGNFYPSAILNVAKNSMGTKGKRRVAVNWEKLLFDNVAHANQIFEGED